MSGHDPLAEALRAVTPTPPAERLNPETLIAYAQNELEPAERDAVLEHLARSPEDADLLLAWWEFREEVPAKPAPADEDAAWQRFEARLAARPAAASVASFPAPSPPLPPPVVASRWMPAALAASLLLAVLSVTWALWERGRNAEDLGIHGNLTLVLLGTDSRERASGLETVRLSQRQERAALVLTPPGDLDAARTYEGRLLSPAGRELWRERLVPSERGTLTLGIEPPRLAPGFYKIQVDERRGTEAIPVALFSFEIVVREPDGGAR